jgi:hypothetical protein
MKSAIEPPVYKNGLLKGTFQNPEISKKTPKIPVIYFYTPLRGVDTSGAGIYTRGKKFLPN